MPFTPFMPFSQFFPGSRYLDTGALKQYAS
jgi:hypothetical protein